jgi:hypothetical protein
MTAKRKGDDETMVDAGQFRTTKRDSSLEGRAMENRTSLRSE